MENNSRISVIVPNFNSHGKLFRTIESIVSQTEPVHEIIIIDDCSNETEQALLYEISTQYENVYCFSLLRNHGGPSIPRNIGKEISSGDWLAFVDSGDTWHPQKIELQQKLIRDGWLAVSSNYEIKKENSAAILVLNFPSVIYLKDQLRCNQVGSPTGLIKKELAPDFLEIRHEDYLFWLQVCRMTPVANFNNYPLATHYRDSGSRSSNLLKNVIYSFKVYGYFGASWKIYKTVRYTFFGAWRRGKELFKLRSAEIYQSIDDSITVCVCGDLRQETLKVLDAVQKTFPGSELIFSTWKMEDVEVSHLPKSIKIIVNDDPGPIDEFSGKTENILRAITLATNGANLATKKYFLKIRSDIQPTLTLKKELNFAIKTLEKFSQKNKPSVMWCDTVGTTQEPFHISDFCLFARRKDASRYYSNILKSINTKTKRLKLLELLKPKQLYYNKRMYHEIIPAESLSFLLGQKNESMSKPDKNWVDLMFEHETTIRKERVKEISAKAFIRPPRLSRYSNMRSAFRYLRGKLKPNGMLARLINSIYDLRKKNHLDG